uniref:Uncharacterized protein n=1 Tax=Oryza barthii TaxID=65489 RepID=A0A0D3FK83_9ORYZ
MASINSFCNHMIFKLILGAIEKLKKKKNSSFATILSSSCCFATGDCSAHRLHLPVVACKRNRKATYSLQTIGSGGAQGRRSPVEAVVPSSWGGGGGGAQWRRRRSGVGTVGRRVSRGGGSARRLGRCSGAASLRTLAAAAICSGAWC